MKRLNLWKARGEDTTTQANVTRYYALKSGNIGLAWHQLCEGETIRNFHIEHLELLGGVHVPEDGS